MTRSLVKKGHSATISPTSFSLAPRLADEKNVATVAKSFAGSA